MSFKQINSKIDEYGDKIFDKVLFERKNMIQNYKSEMLQIDKEIRLKKYVFNINSDLKGAKNQINELKKKRDM
jgi:hypothetical protein